MNLFVDRSNPIALSPTPQISLPEGSFICYLSKKIVSVINPEGKRVLAPAVIYFTGLPVEKIKRILEEKRLAVVYVENGEFDLNVAKKFKDWIDKNKVDEVILKKSKTERPLIKGDWGLGELSKNYEEAEERIRKTYGIPKTLSNVDKPAAPAPSTAQLTDSMQNLSLEDGGAIIAQVYNGPKGIGTLDNHPLSHIKGTFLMDWRKGHLIMTESAVKHALKCENKTIPPEFWNLSNLDPKSRKMADEFFHITLSLSIIMN